MVPDVATPPDVPEHAPDDITRVAVRVRSTRRLAAHTHLIRLTHRVDHTEAEVLAAVADADRAEALHVNAGRACVRCGCRFDVTGVARRPVDENARHPLFVCAWAHCGGAA